MTNIPAKIQRSCFNASVGFVSDISSGRMDTKAKKKLMQPTVMTKKLWNRKTTLKQYWSALDVVIRQIALLEVIKSLIKWNGSV